MIAFLVLLAAYVLSQFFRSFLAIIAGDLTRDIGLDAADLGLVSAVWFIAFAVAQFPVGLALDRQGPRATVAGFMVSAVIGALWFAAATSRWECIAAMALIGVGCAPVLMGSLYLFARIYPPERFALLASAMIGFSSIGNLLGTAPLAYAVAAFGWRPSLMVIAALTLVSVILTALALRDPPPLNDETKHDSFMAGIAAMLRLRALWPLLPLTLTGYAVVIAIRSLWIAPYFGHVHGFGITAQGQAAFAMAVAMTIFAFAYGPLERVVGGPKPLVLGGTVVAGASLVAIALMGSADAGAALVLFAAVGGFGMTYGMMMAHARGFIPAPLLGRGVTFMNFVFIGGAGVVQWLSGLHVRGTLAGGGTPELAYATLFGAMGVVLLLCAGIYGLSQARPTTAA